MSPPPDLKFTLSRSQVMKGASGSTGKEVYKDRDADFSKRSGRRRALENLESNTREVCTESSANATADLQCLSNEDSKSSSSSWRLR